MGILSTIVGPIVAIASKVLPLLLGGILQDAKSSSQVYRLGNIAWFPHSGKLYAQNVGNNEASLQFSVVEAAVSGAPGATFSSTLYQPLAVSGSVDVSDALTDYQDGSLAIGTEADTILPPAAMGGLRRAIAFSICSLSAATSVKLVGEVFFSVERNIQNGLYEIRFGSKNPFDFSEWEVEAKVTNMTDITVSVGANVGKHQVLNEVQSSLIIELPEGFELTPPIIKQLVFNITVPQDYYEEVTAERRRLVRMGMKLPQ